MKSALGWWDITVSKRDFDAVFKYTYLGPSQTSTMALFSRKVNG